jgi:L-malate glycosyltransferase
MIAPSGLLVHGGHPAFIANALSEPTPKLSTDSHDCHARTAAKPPIRIGFVLHVMNVAGAEMLVAETIRRLGPQVDPCVLCLDGVGELGERLRSEGVPVVALGRRPGVDWRVARQLAREISARGLEVVHAHQYTPFFYTALARTVVRAPVHVMFTEHGRHFPDVVSRKRRMFNRLLLSRLADEVNAVSAFSAESLAALDGFGARRIEVIENGIDPGRYDHAAVQAELRAELGLSPDRHYVACVARFHPVKDHATLLKAFGIVAAARDDVDLILAGDGPLRDTLTSLADTLGISARVKFLGVRSDVARILQASDVFTLTSVSEAASLTLLEAMACARPVVVTRVGGNPEIVEHGVHGYLAPRGDADAIARALLDVIEQPEAARAMGAAGRALVRQRYLLDRTITRYYDRYATAAQRIRDRATPTSGRV